MDRCDEPMLAQFWRSPVSRRKESRSPQVASACHGLAQRDMEHPSLGAHCREVTERQTGCQGQRRARLPVSAIAAAHPVGRTRIACRWPPVGPGAKSTLREIGRKAALALLHAPGRQNPGFIQEPASATISVECGGCRGQGKWGIGQRESTLDLCCSRLARSGGTLASAGLGICALDKFAGVHYVAGGSSYPSFRLLVPAEDGCHWVSQFLL